MVSDMNIFVWKLSKIAATKKVFFFTFFGLLRFLVFFNGLFATTSQNRMSNIFRDSDSLGKSNGKKWSNIWSFLFGSGLKLPRKKKFFLLILPWYTLLWRRCYYPHRSRDALSPVCGIFLCKKKKKCNFYFLTCDMWQVTCDRWQVTGDTWHVIRDIWHVTRDMFGGVNILSKFQLPSSYRLWFMILWRSGGKGWITELINEWMNDKAVYRKAPATPGLLNIYMVRNHQDWYPHINLS